MSLKKVSVFTPVLAAQLLAASLGFAQSPCPPQSDCDKCKQEIDAKFSDTAAKLTRPPKGQEANFKEIQRILEDTKRTLKKNCEKNPARYNLKEPEAGYADKQGLSLK